MRSFNGDHLLYHATQMHSSRHPMALWSSFNGDMKGWSASLSDPRSSTASHLLDCMPLTHLSIKIWPRHSKDSLQGNRWKRRTSNSLPSLQCWCCFCCFGRWSHPRWAARPMAASVNTASLIGWGTVVHHASLFWAAWLDACGAARPNLSARRGVIVMGRSQGSQIARNACPGANAAVRPRWISQLRLFYLNVALCAWF